MSHWSQNDWPYDQQLIGASGIDRVATLTNWVYRCIYCKQLTTRHLPAGRITLTKQGVFVDISQNTRRKQQKNGTATFWIFPHFPTKLFFFLKSLTVCTAVAAVNNKNRTDLSSCWGAACCDPPLPPHPCRRRTGSSWWSRRSRQPCCVYILSGWEQGGHARPTPRGRLPSNTQLSRTSLDSRLFILSSQSIREVWRFSVPFMICLSRCSIVFGVI